MVQQKYCSPKCNQKHWVKSNPQRDREAKRRYRLKQPVLCRGCGSPIPTELRGMGITYCSDECRKKSRKDSSRQYRINRRLLVMGRLGGAICVYCGCNEFGALEINHKNGGGSRDYRDGAGPKLVNDIYYGRKKESDFNVACRVCNAWHYISKKLNVDNWKVLWTLGDGQ